ncbi:hypothetical protein [Deinococcus sp. NW-56]|uniref:hypothetical protein n=1 Tax=Deinococcus sp. NW-56 TaxID=2080419 RepID=UPI000CF41AD3|nr:hypothetical protein [Deinococcus sp. NW-56]
MGLSPGPASTVLRFLRGGCDGCLCGRLCEPCRDAGDSGYSEGTVLRVTPERVVLTDGRVFRRPPGGAPRPGQAVVIDPRPGIVWHGQAHVPKAQRPAEDPPFIPQPVTRSLSVALPQYLPSAGLSTRFDSPETLEWTDGWHTHSTRVTLAALPTQLLGDLHPLAVMRTPSGGALVVAAPYPSTGGRIVRGSAVRDGLTLFRVPPPTEDGDPPEPTITTLPPPVQEGSDPPGTPRNGSAFLYLVAGASGAGALRVVYATVSHEGEDVAAQSDIFFVLVNILHDGNYTVQVTPWQPLGDFARFRRAEVNLRSASTPDGVVYIHAAGRWWRADGAGIIEVPAAPQDTLQPVEYNPDAGKSEAVVLAQQLTSPPGQPDSWHRYPAALYRGVSWVDRPDLQATVVARERLSGGLTLVRLSGLPPGLLSGMGNDLGGGAVLPHVPGLLFRDPDRLVYEAATSDRVVTWEAQGGMVGGLATIHRPAGSDPADTTGYPDVLSRPDTVYAPPPLTGRELFPVTLSADSGSLTGTAARLVVPALAPQLATRVTWRVPEGEHALNVTFPPAEARAYALSFAVRADWKAINRGDMVLRVAGRSVFGPHRERGWWQDAHAVLGDATGVAITLTTTRPTVLYLAQLSLLTTEQESP